MTFRCFAFFLHIYFTITTTKISEEQLREILEEVRKLRRKRKGKMISPDDDGTKEGEEEKGLADEEVSYVK